VGSDRIQQHNRLTRQTTDKKSVFRCDVTVTVPLTLYPDDGLESAPKGQGKRKKK